VAPHLYKRGRVRIEKEGGGGRKEGGNG